MPFSPLPQQAAWRHREARDGFEVVFLRRSEDGYHIEGHTAACEDAKAWSVRYDIDVDTRWVTRRARVTGHSESGRRDVTLENDGTGHWRIDGVAAPHLTGCPDVDLEASAFTNAFPVHRLELEIGDGASAPAAYVRVLDLRVERLEQHYLRVQDDGVHQCFDYESPAFGTRCLLVYDESGLVLDYPGIALRVV